MGFTPDFLDEIRNRIPVSDVVARRVRLVRKGHEHSGLCPFHSEKTPSFTVNDDKAFYHCFGCGAHGDVIKFITETEGLSFLETVERLAAQAGLELPVNTARDRQQAKQKKTLYDVMATAAGWFENQLVARTGKPGLDYLTRRGLTRDTIKKFRLGFAPEGRTVLRDALLGRDGISEDMMIEAGLLIRPEDGEKTSYDRFRHRVMFPITDRQGRVVAFGGRALRADVRAKYLNSPETPLFHKGRLLYNLAGARKSAYDQGRVLVAEGYMDVIALAQAGFTNAVAPLGTAVTVEQIAELWRLAAEPLMCFDGDRAGIQAACRVAEKSLPLLKAGYSLRFIHLPEGEDPDSYIGSQGAQAFRTLLMQARNLIDIIWDMKTASVATDTPEQQAGLEQSLAETLAEISDKTIRGYYDREFQKRLARLLGGAFVPDHSLEKRIQKKNHSDYPVKSYDRKDNFRRNINLPGIKSLKNTDRVKPGDQGNIIWEKLLILMVLNHPWLIQEHHEEFATTYFDSAELDKLRCEIIDVSLRESDLDHKSLYSHLLKTGYGRALKVIFDQGKSKLNRYAWPDAARQDVERGWFHAFNRYRRVSDLEKEFKTAEKDLAENMTEDVFARFLALKAELENAKGQ